MKVVQIKLEGSDYDSTQVSLRRVRNLWIGYFVLIIANLSLEIFEKVDLNSKDQNDKTKVFAVVTTFLGLLQYAILAYYQWSLFYYFISKKKQRMKYKAELAK